MKQLPRTSICYDKETKTSTNKTFIQINNQHTLFCIACDDKSFNEKNVNKLEI